MVVGDQMNSTADRVALKLRHLQSLGDDPLTREGRVSVNQNRNDFFTLARVSALALLGANHAENNRIHGLEMRRVVRK